MAPPKDPKSLILLDFFLLSFARIQAEYTYMKYYHFIRSMRDKNDNYMVLFHVGNYCYEICVKDRTYKIDGDVEDAINVMESLAVL